MLVKTTNPAPTKTEAKVQPSDMLRHVIVAGKSTRTAACELCYSGAAFIFLVNHFRDSKDKEYMTKSDAVDYLQKQIKEQANVQGGMLNLYIRNASALVGVLVGSARMFSATIQQLANAETPADMVSILSKWMDANYGKRVESMSSLSEALGYKTSRPTGKATPQVTAAKAVASVENVIKKVEKLVTTATGAGKPKETVIAQTIANNVASPVTLVRETIKRIKAVQELDAIIQWCNDQKRILRDLATKAQEAIQEAKPNGKGIVTEAAKRKAKRSPVQQAQA